MNRRPDHTMNTELNQQRLQQMQSNPALQGLQPFAGAHAHTPHLADPQQKYTRKIVDTLQEAVQRVGMKDGMTISFHHGYREGDRCINSVVQILADMGFKNLTLAPSSLMSCNTPLITHIQSGVIRRIYTSGMRGKLAEAISNGLMAEPVHIHSHGGRAHLIQTGRNRH
jgi:citrate lyase subunit alpha/citrate CoA-transferase